MQVSIDQDLCANSSRVEWLAGAAAGSCHNRVLRADLRRRPRRLVGARAHPFGAVHYQRWLDLFDTTLDVLFAGPTAAVARRRAGAWPRRCVASSTANRRPATDPSRSCGRDTVSTQSPG
jgi:hypothetical protein